MAKNQKVNYSEMSKEDLQKAIITEKKNINRMEFNHAVSPLANPIEIRTARRNVARMLTTLSTK